MEICNDLGFGLVLYCVQHARFHVSPFFFLSFLFIFILFFICMAFKLCAACIMKAWMARPYIIHCVTFQGLGSCKHRTLSYITINRFSTNLFRYVSAFIRAITLDLSAVFKELHAFVARAPILPLNMADRKRNETE